MALAPKIAAREDLRCSKAGFLLPPECTQRRQKEGYMMKGFLDVTNERCLLVYVEEGDEQKSRPIPIAH